MQTTNTAPEIIDDAPDKVKADLRKFNKAEDQVNKALAALSTVENISDQVGLDAALDIIGKAKKVDKIIEDKRVSLVKPYNDEVKRINQCAKDLAAKLPPAIKKASDVVLDYNRLLEQKRIEARTEQRRSQLMTMQFTLVDGFYVNGEIKVGEDAVKSYDDSSWMTAVNHLVFMINERIARQKAEMEAKSDVNSFFGEETTTEEVKAAEELKPIEAPVVKHVPSFGSQSVKGVTKRWTFSVIDPALVPREYLVVDEAKIRAAMNAGVRDIPGVKFEQTTSLTSR